MERLPDKELLNKSVPLDKRPRCSIYRALEITRKPTACPARALPPAYPDSGNKAATDTGHPSSHSRPPASRGSVARRCPSSQPEPRRAASTPVQSYPASPPKTLALAPPDPGQPSACPQSQI